MSEFEKLSLPELLDRLADISVPEPMPYTPQTVGWLFLALLLLVAFLATVWRMARRWRANRYRREALVALSTIEARVAHGQDLAAEIARLLRRTALTAFPRETVASLHGEAWLYFLDESYGRDGFSSGLGRSLATAPYDGTADMSPEGRQALVQEARTWIERHRAGQRHA